MGSLKPGATYIYERDRDITYAREFGSAPSTRFVVGYGFDPKNPPPETMPSGKKELDDHNEWIKIRLAGKTNPTLQKAIDRVKMLYKLSMEKYE